VRAVQQSSALRRRARVPTGLRAGSCSGTGLIQLNVAERVTANTRTSRRVGRCSARGTVQLRPPHRQPFPCVFSLTSQFAREVTQERAAKDATLPGALADQQPAPPTLISSLSPTRSGSPPRRTACGFSSVLRGRNGAKVALAGLRNLLPLFRISSGTEPKGEVRGPDTLAEGHVG
jgi:hypothetical protein